MSAQRGSDVDHLSIFTQKSCNPSLHVWRLPERQTSLECQDDSRGHSDSPSYSSSIWYEAPIPRLQRHVPGDRYCQASSVFLTLRNSICSGGNLYLDRSMYVFGEPTTKTVLYATLHDEHSIDRTAVWRVLIYIDRYSYN